MDMHTSTASSLRSFAHYIRNALLCPDDGASEALLTGVGTRFLLHELGAANVVAFNDALKEEGITESFFIGHRPSAICAVIGSCALQRARKGLLQLAKACRSLGMGLNVLAVASPEAHEALGYPLNTYEALREELQEKLSSDQWEDSWDDWESWDFQEEGSQLKVTVDYLPLHSCPISDRFFTVSPFLLHGHDPFLHELSENKFPHIAADGLAHAICGLAWSTGWRFECYGIGSAGKDVAKRVASTPLPLAPGKQRKAALIVVERAMDLGTAALPNASGLSELLQAALKERMEEHSEVCHLPFGLAEALPCLESAASWDDIVHSVVEGRGEVGSASDAFRRDWCEKPLTETLRLLEENARDSQSPPMRIAHSLWQERCSDKRSELERISADMLDAAVEGRSDHVAKCLIDGAHAGQLQLGHLLALCIGAYAIGNVARREAQSHALEASPFSLQNENAVKDAVTQAVLHSTGANEGDASSWLDRVRSELLTSHEGAMASAKMRVRQNVESKFKRLHSALRWQRTSEGKNEGISAGESLAGRIAQQILVSGEVQAASHQSGALGRVIKGGLTRFGLQKRVKPGDFGEVVIFFLGGCCPGDVEAVRRLEEESGQPYSFFVGGTSLLGPARLAEAFFG